MTDKKEEIIKKHTKTEYEHVGAYKQSYQRTNYRAAMTEYADSQAKERAVGFAEWLQDEGYKPSTSEKGKYIKEVDFKTIKYFTITELYTEYEIFTKQK